MPIEAALDARRLLLEYFPNDDPVWFAGEEHGGYRIDAFVAGALPDAHASYVASVRIDGVFVAESVSEYPHTPYDPADVNGKPPHWRAPGVFAWTLPVHSPATQARFDHGGAIHTATVAGAHCALFVWDTGWLGRRSQPALTGLLVDGAWVPPVSNYVAATSADFRRAFGAYSQDGRDADWWARDAFFEQGRFKEKIRMVEALIEPGGLSGWALGCLSAGPVEDLVSHELLDYVTADPGTRARWRPLLLGTNLRGEPESLQRRLRCLLHEPGPVATPP